MCFVPAEKAANNIIRVWRKFFIEVLCKEITLSPTFQLPQFSENDLVNKHKLLAASYQADPNYKKVQTMYWLPSCTKPITNIDLFRLQAIFPPLNCLFYFLELVGTIKNLVIKVYDNSGINFSNKVYENSGIISFGISKIRWNYLINCSLNWCFRICLKFWFFYPKCHFVS